MKAELLRIQNIALDNRSTRMNLTIYEDEILLVCGLSDAGLLNLADILSGLAPMPQGSLWVQEQPKSPQWLRSPSENWIFRFQSKPAVLEQLTVAENIFVITGKKKSSPFVNYREINPLATQILNEVGLHIPPEAIVSTLRTVEIHIIELIRATFFGARLIILDDNFDGYSPKDRQLFYGIIKTLHGIGISFLIFSSEHEALSTLFHRLTIIRDGENIKSIEAKHYNKDEVYRYMLGGPIHTSLQPPLAPPAHWMQEPPQPAFSAANIASSNLRNITFSAYPGEVVALLDIHGTDLHQFLDTLLYGAPYYGTFSLASKPLGLHSRDALSKQGLGMIDYKDDTTLFETLSWPENLSIMYRIRMGRHVALSAKKCADLLAQEYADLLDGLPADVPLNTLSITPYQYLTLKYLCWIVRKPAVLLCIRPYASTDLIMRGVVDTMLTLATSKDICVLIASSNPNEATACASRIVTIENGRTTQSIRK